MHEWKIDFIVWTWSNKRSFYNINIPIPLWNIIMELCIAIQILYTYSPKGLTYFSCRILFSFIRCFYIHEVVCISQQLLLTYCYVLLLFFIVIRTIKHKSNNVCLHSMAVISCLRDILMMITKTFLLCVDSWMENPRFTIDILF